MNKICLGTAKIGMPNYGYSSSGYLENASSFLLDSIKLGINYFDTSPRYGDCESILGETLNTLSSIPFLNTKIDELETLSTKTPSRMTESIQLSLQKLHVKTVDVCYLHQNQIEIISDKYVHQGMQKLKSEGLVKEFGTSVYSKEELKYTMECDLFDWVQVPVNILDTSFLQAICGTDSGIKVAARSVFLQGILLNRQSIQSDITDNKPLLEALKIIDELCATYDIGIKELSVAYLSSLERINSIIIGTTSMGNLRKNIESATIVLDKQLKESLDGLSMQSKSWTNPRHWHKPVAGQ